MAFNFEAIKRRSCTSKFPYDKPTQARRGLKALKDNKGSNGLEIYRCLFGDHFHIGHEIPNELKKRVRDELERRDGGF